MFCFNKRLGCMESEHNAIAKTVHKLMEMIGQSVISPDKSYLKSRTKFYNEFEEQIDKFKE